MFSRFFVSPARDAYRMQYPCRVDFISIMGELQSQHLPYSPHSHWSNKVDLPLHRTRYDIGERSLQILRQESPI